MVNTATKLAKISGITKFLRKFAIMEFKFCPECGARLEGRELGDEGIVPWCGQCNKPWFPMFASAIIALVYNERNEVLLLRQGYISNVYANLVSGYIKPGETAEQTAIREIMEETGQEVEELRPVQTNWFEKKGIMMLGYFARVKEKPLRLSCEVDSAQWVKAEEAVRLVHPYPTSTSRILAEKFLCELRSYS